MKLKKNIQMRDYTQVNGYADEKPILKESLMEVANKTCKSNPNCNNCSECMKGSPYRFCCKDECGEHEFCRGCAYRDSRK